MIEMIVQGTRIPYVRQKSSVSNIDVHKGLQPIRSLLTYLEELWRSRVTIVDGFAGSVRLPHPYGQAASRVMAGMLAENRLKRSSRKMRHPAYTTSDHSRCTRLLK